MKLRRALLCSGVAVLAALSVGLLPTQLTFAYHYDPMNDYERWAKHGSGSGLSSSYFGENPSVPDDHCDIGTIWITDHPDNYYGASTFSVGNQINVGWGNKTRTVYIAGSYYAYSNATSNTAHNVKEDKSRSNYLKSVGSGSEGSLYRGYASRTGAFSDKGSTLKAILNTDESVLPMKSGAKVTIIVYLHRCFYENTGCGTAAVPFVLKRDAPPWEVEGTTKIKTTQSGQTEWKTGMNAYRNTHPDETIYWQHTIKEKNKSDIPANSMQVNIDKQFANLSDGRSNWGFNSAYGDNSKGFGYVSGKKNTTVFNKNGQSEEFAKITVKYSDADKMFCERVAWSPSKGSSSGDWGTSAQACTTVPYHYPGDDPNDDSGVGTSVSSNKDDFLPGETVTFNYSIHQQTNSGVTWTKDINYRIYTFVLKGDSSLPSNGGSSALYPKGWGSVGCGGRDVTSSDTRYCENTQSGSTGQITPGESKSYSLNYTVDGNWLGDPGDQICSYIALDDQWSVVDGVNSNNYLASRIKCVRIGKKPQMQITGSDSYAKGGFTGGDYSAIDININRGSFSQYGLLTGTTAARNFGSGGYTAVNKDRVQSCQATFSNVRGGVSSSPTNCKNDSLINAGITINEGNVSSPSTPATFVSVPQGNASIDGIVNACRNAGKLANCNVELHSASNEYILGGGTLPAGSRINIYTTKQHDKDIDVTIDGNIVVDQNHKFNSVSEMPVLNLVVSNGDVNIDSNVTEIYGNYVIKKGAFNSCNDSDEADLGIIDKCNKKLKVNGAVLSQESPVMHRTFGSGNNAGSNQYDNSMITSSAEWFNYTPNTWLTPFSNSGVDIRGYSTADVTGLPARY